jgi:hypothetical protein
MDNCIIVWNFVVPFCGSAVPVPYLRTFNSDRKLVHENVTGTGTLMDFSATF